ncbi:hypothetical protein Tco_0625255 [Tanacetum coccineum]|uniref:Uncharacterized protein n=1 Tax=Tanacetum coccineum TaxID=301880 RepID=A0ABQ4WGB3_9ASTR
MSAKDSIAIQTCELSEKEFNDFLALYPIPPAYHVILPKSNQTVFDAPPGYVGLFIYLDLTLLVMPNRLPLLLRAKLMVLSPPLSYSEGSLIFVGLLIYDLPFLLTEMDFRNFVYAEDEEYLSFLPKEPSPGFGTYFPFASVNIEPLRSNEEPVLQPAEVIADSGGSPKPELFVLHPGSVAARIKDRKCKIKGGSSRTPMERKLAYGSLNSRAKTSTSKDDVPFLIVSDYDEGLFDVPELKDATAVVDNDVNRRSRELLEVIEKLRGECNVIKERERAWEEVSKSVRVMCEAAMSDIERNPTVIALREKISTLSIKVKEHKANIERMMLESQKWASYQAILSTLESQIASLEAEKARLEDVKVSIRKEVDDVKQDRMEVVSLVVPYAAIELIHCDDLASLVGRLVSSAIFYWRCKAFEQVAAMKEPFDLSKVKGYHPSYKKEHDQAGNDLAITTFPWLSEFIADPLAPVKVLLSKKPSSLQRPAPLKTQALLPLPRKLFHFLF